jgi:serine/threonine-protein kinase
LNLGIALRKKGELTKAIEHYRRAIELKPDFAEASCYLALALRQAGYYEEALQAIKRGHELGSRRTDWRYPSARWGREIRELARREPGLLAIIRGERASEDATEQVEAADLALRRRLCDRSAHLYQDAFATDPSLAPPAARQHRYNAACAAALAGCGRGKHAKSHDDATRAKWRKQALAWLRADLQHWSQLLERDAGHGEGVARTLNHWLRDRDLAGVRDPEALAKLPGEEKEAWRVLWTEVRALLQKTR